MLEKVGPFVEGQKVKASWMQQILVALKSVLNITAAPPLRAGYGPNGLTISLGVNLAGVKRFKAISLILSSSISTSTSVCWLCKEIDQNGNVASDQIPVWTQLTVAANQIFFAIKPTNGTGLTYNPGTAVPVEWTSVTTDPVIDVKSLVITGTLTISGGGTLSGGIYKASLGIPLAASTIQVTGSTYTAGNIINTGSSSNAYFVNLVEKGQTTHDLSNTTNFATIVIGLNVGTAYDGFPVYVGPMVWPGCA